VVGWLVGWLVDWLVGWLVGWSVDQNPYTGSNVEKTCDRKWVECERWWANSVLHPDVCL